MLAQGFHCSITVCGAKEPLIWTYRRVPGGAVWRGTASASRQCNSVPTAAHVCIRVVEFVRFYFVHRPTNKTQWTWPDEVPKPEAAGDGGWRSAKDPTSGKVYYVAGTQTTWDVPKEVVEAAITASARSGAAASSGAGDDSDDEPTIIAPTGVCYGGRCVRERTRDLTLDWFGSLRRRWTHST